MAEAIRIQVDKNTYRETLSSLDAQLGALKGHRTALENDINRLKGGNIFSGSDVRVAITKAEDALEKVKDAISRVTGYRVAIEQQLSGVEQAATQLQSDMTNIDLPNMFQ